MKLPRFNSVLGRRVLGIVVIIGTVLIVSLAILRPNPFKDTVVVEARFDNISGLGRIDRNVRVGGANAGSVGAVEREGDDVVVELELEPGIVVHTDARADLRPHTLFEGSAFVDLHPGSPSAPLLEEGKAIPKAQTSNYTSLDEALRVLDDDNRQALKEVVQATSKTLRGPAIASLRKTLKAAPPLVENLGPTARALQGPGRVELQGAITGLARTLEAVASREADLAPLIERTSRTLAALDVDGGAPLDAALAALPGGLEELEADGGRLALFADTLDETAAALIPAVEQLGPVLRDSRPLLERTPPILIDATPLIAQLRTVLSRASAAAPALEEAIRILRPSSKLLLESILPVLTGDSRYGIPSYAQLVASFTGGAATARNYQTAAQSESPGHIIRAGAYLDPEGFVGGLAVPDCTLIAALDPEIAQQLQALGLCQ